MPDSVEIKESGKLAKPPEQSGKMLAQIITPGKGSSGTYPASVLEAAAKDRLVKAGTPLYLDHPTEAEAYERPGRSVKDLVAVFTEDARWTGDALVAEAQIFSPYRPLLSEMAPYIGLSIRGSGLVSEGGVVEALDSIESVDFVTAAGRGGKVLQMLESARQSGIPIREATASDTDRAIQDAVSAAYNDQEAETYSWVRDYDPDKKLAFFEISVGGVCTTYSQTYAMSDTGDVELTGERSEVNQRTEYVPAAATEAAPPIVPVHPAGQSTTTKEHTMPEIEEGAKVSILETKLRTLEADAGRVPALEAKVVAETARADVAEQDLAVEKAREYARTFGVARVKESNGDLPSAVVDKIVADAMREIPLTEADKAVDRRLDTEAFGKRVDESQKNEETYLASIVESGNGRVRGVGSTDTKAEVTEAHVDNIVAGAFGRKTVKGA